MQTEHAAGQDITILGKVATAFGIKGWVKVYSYTDPVTSILDYPIWWLNINGQWRECKVSESKVQSKGIVALLAGCNDRDAALALAQTEIGVPTSMLPELNDDEHYWFQLEGLKVITTDGVLLGQVKELFDSGGGNQVLVVSACAGSVDEQQRLIPYVGQYILEVDLDKGEIQADWDPDF
ncbi:MAG: ribosome maturation factor RimM [Bacterioplanes sp.]|nr:ribosome maturation factor RimM [Bacterioplanes sp.]